MYYIMSCTEKPIVFKDLKAATEYASKQYFGGQMPLWIVEQYVLFGHSHPKILEKLIAGQKLNKREQKIMDAGQQYKKTAYTDGDCIDDAIDIQFERDAPQEAIDKIFTNDVKPEDSELVKPEDVPEPLPQEKFREILEKENTDEC